MDMYGLSEQDIKFKYNTKAAAFYRKKLRSLALNEEFDEEEPSLQEVVMIINALETTEETKNEEYDVAKEDFDQPKKKNILYDAVNATKKFSNKVATKAKDFSEKPKVKEFSDKTKLFFEKVNTKMKAVVQKTKESETYQKAKEKSVSVMNSIADSAKRTMKKFKKSDQEPQDHV